MDYEAAGGVSYVVEGETSDDGQGSASCWFQNADVAGFDDGEGVDGVVKLPRVSGEVDLIVRHEVLEGAEKCIAVAGDGHITRLARQRGAGDMTDGARESEFIHTLFDDGGKMETWNRDAADYAGPSGGWRTTSVSIGQ